MKTAPRALARSLRKRVRLFLSLASLLIGGTGNLSADGPADNLADNVRPIPPVGIEVSSNDKQALLNAAQGLRSKVMALAKTSTSDRAEILVFARAIEMQVEDGMFYTEKEVEQARELLRLGEARLELLGAGHSGARLIGTSASPSSKPQLVAGGFQSQIDGSIQPYGLVLPADAKLDDGKPRRLDVWLHGRGEKSSEAAFLYQRLHNLGEIAPSDTLVLHPYGRYCNAFKFAGEIDVLEAIEHVKQLYAIDENRIVIRGFSMGGAGCWQMAVHYPGKWMAATPGAGFSETIQFLKVFQKEDFQPNPTQRSLLHWYDCPDWSNNLRLLPTIAYSGEIDSQKQAADVMEAAMKERGLTLKHLIGPQTGHKIHPDSKIEIEKFLTSASSNGRPDIPLEIDFTTYSLRYPNHGWLTLEGLESHWNEARVQAKIQSRSSLLLTTKNVASLSIAFPREQKVLSHQSPLVVKIDGNTLTIPLVPNAPTISASFIKQNGSWNRVDSLRTGGIRKRPGLQGPIDDAFLTAFVFVGPDASRPAPSAVDGWAMQELDHAKKEWRRHFRGDIKELNSTSLSSDDLATKNLILFGTPESNSTIGKIVGKLPVVWNGKEISIGTQKFDAGQFAPVMIYPNPLNPDRYVVINSGFTYREYAYLNNARQIAMLPDWAVIDVRSGRNSQLPGKIAAAGFFDETWSVK